MRSPGLSKPIRPRFALASTGASRAGRKPLKEMTPEDSCGMVGWAWLEGRSCGGVRSVLENLPVFRSRNERHHGMSCARSRPSFALLAALSLTWLLTVQMTPALCAGALRGFAPRPAHWRTGCRHSLRSASCLKHQGAPDCVGVLRAWGVGRRLGRLAARTIPTLSALLKHHLRFLGRLIVRP